MSFSQNETNPEKILDEVSKKIKTYSTIKIKFINGFENKKDKINESKEGTLYLKGEMYKLEFKGQSVMSDNKTVWTLIDDANEVQINNVITDEDAINPANIFNLYKKGYKSKFIKDELKAGVTYHIIDLVPIKGKSHYKVRVMVDKNKKHITECIVYEKNGNMFTFKIKELTPNVTLENNFFTFNKSKYPNIEVIDLR
ncbi:MAG: hypothetical protein A2X12_11050 [Bacteroidetes bacterium GWE2_29_8]|nr:MAG: hypothetical protein A2X12_11050 [Bacteroidetes bacterium GWE2_29_8]OFY22826.1 MAG: hypothetical protein A2X02_07075 [Bacteroidetes bacterium GWF2_29_10]